jgi:hypothetical protein
MSLRPWLFALMAGLLITAPLVAGADDAIEWSQDKDGKHKSYTIDGVAIAISDELNADNESPRVQLTAPDGATVTVYGAERTAEMPVSLRVTRLDPAHSKVDVMPGAYNGGAHCCIVIKVVSLIDGAWKITDLGQWDGDGMPAPRDLGDGKPPVVIFPDNAFFYAFTSYAGSGAPLKAFRIEDGKTIDVSTDPALKPLHEENMREYRKPCVEEHDNGACAPYVASAARIGQFAEAWKVMLQNYDRNSDWQLDFCDVGGADGKCAKSVSFKTFPQALDWFLHRHGYLPPSAP